MYSPSRAIMIVGVVVIAFLVIAVSTFIYNSATSTISDSMTSFSTQEIEAFNNNFESYAGEQTGSNVKALITRMIANAKTYSDEEEKVPNAYFDKTNKTIKLNSDIDSYVDELTKIKNDIENKHTYTISFTYRSSGFIETISILSGEVGEDTSEEENVVSSETTELTKTEIYAQNEMFESYKGRITGKNVRTLLSRLDSNCETYYESHIEMIPTVYDEKTDTQISMESGTETEKIKYSNALSKIENDIESKHVYYVELTYDESNIVNSVSIWYDTEDIY